MKIRLFERMLACALLLLPAIAYARPALWVVKDADTTIYLFGTVHLLPKDTDWRSPALDRALHDSSRLVVEIVDDDQANMTALVLRYGLDPAHPLSSLLTADEQGRLQRAARMTGVPGGSAGLNMMRPWLAALTLAATPLTKAGLDPAQGVDKQLRTAMTAAGKPVSGLETAEQQIRFLADMPQSLQLALLRSTLRDSEHAKVQFTAILDAWQRGDDAAIAKLENALMQREQPRLYQRLVVDRNKSWAARIKAMLDQPGIMFVAVGAAHLAGPDSVQAQLAALGVNTVRE